jgi:hypothetical protein
MAVKSLPLDKAARKVRFFVILLSPDAVLAPDQNIENNPMQSSMLVAGMDALRDRAKTF